MAEPTASLPTAPSITVNAPTTLPTGVQLQPSWDPIEILPVGTPQDRLRLLRQHSLDLHAITVPHSDIQAAAAARTNAENTLKRLRAPAAEGGFSLPPEAAQVMTAQRALDRATDEFERVRARSEARAAAWQTSSQASAAVEAWLRQGIPGNCTLVAVETDLPKPSKGEAGVLDQIETRRRRVRSLLATKHTIESAPFPSAFAKQRVRAMVDQLSQRGEPDVTLLLEHDREVIWPTSRVQAEVYGAERALAFHEAVDVVGLLAFLFKDQLTQKLCELVDEASDDKVALTADEREVRLAEVMRDTLSVEREECELVFAAQAQSLPVEHRGDIAPQALLGVELRTVPRAIDGPSTSPLAFDLVRTGGRRR